MKLKNLPIIIALLGAIAIQGCNDDNLCSPATGEVIREELSLEEFKKVSLAIAADVYISRGDVQKVLIEAQSSVVDEVMKTSVINQDWDIAFEDCINTTEGINIYITIPELSQINISGSGAVTVEDTFDQTSVILKNSGSGAIIGKFNSTNMDCSISGSGSITLTGSTEASDISISGSGSVSAFDLPSNACTVSISGSGNVDVTVSETLNVSIAGSGNVRYKGNPSIETSISGSGRVVNAN